MKEYRHKDDDIDHLEDTHLATAEDDSWFVHSPDEPHAQHAHGRVNESIVGGVLLLIIIATFLVIGIFIGYVPRAVATLRSERQELKESAYAEFADKKAVWEGQLAGWDEAARRVVEEYSHAQ